MIYRCLLHVYLNLDICWDCFVYELLFYCAICFPHVSTTVYLNSISSNHAWHLTKIPIVACEENPCLTSSTTWILTWFLTWYIQRYLCFLCLRPKCNQVITIPLLDTRMILIDTNVRISCKFCQSSSIFSDVSDPRLLWFW